MVRSEGGIVLTSTTASSELVLSLPLDSVADSGPEPPDSESDLSDPEVPEGLSRTDSVAAGGSTMGASIAREWTLCLTPLGGEGETRAETIWERVVAVERRRVTQEYDISRNLGCILYQLW